MPEIFLNCDLGEWESPQQTAAMMPYLHMANIACGGHAGSAKSIAHCAELANKQQPYAVSTGAHPGLPLALSPDRGRSTPDSFSVEQFCNLLELQLNRYICYADLNHIKLHGALYHLTENDSEFRQAFLKLVKSKFLISIICQAGGKVEQNAESLGLPVTPEIFLDRNYKSDGSLLPRNHPEAIINNQTNIIKRLELLQESNSLKALDGSTIKLSNDYDHISACIHSDSPNSLKILKAARTFIET